MKNVLLFGVTREIVGEQVVGFPESDFPSDVAALKERLIGKYPKLGEITSLRVAVNSEFATEETKISLQDEVALIPPVSGG